MAVLIGMSQEVKGKSVEIGTEKITLGRKSDNTIPMENPTVSGHHCEVFFEDERYQVRDLGSTNGTRLNNREIKDAKLRPKDILQVGSIEFMFDASPGEKLRDEPELMTNVEIAPGPAAAPESFDNISPFGARKAENRGLWFLIIVILGLVALAAVGVFFFKLITES